MIHQDHCDIMWLNLPLHLDLPLVSGISVHPFLTSPHPECYINVHSAHTDEVFGNFLLVAAPLRS